MFIWERIWKHTENMRWWFHTRGYPKHQIQKEMKNIKFSKINWIKWREIDLTKEINLWLRTTPWRNLCRAWLSIWEFYTETNMWKKSLHLELWLRFVAPENLFNYWGINFLVVAKLCPWREWLAYVNVMESGVLRV